jgi:ankyrin repeat domain-containing protein 50
VAERSTHKTYSPERILKRRSTDPLTPISDAEKSCLILFSEFHVADYKAELPKPVEGTCNWILKNPQYVSWAAERKSTLLWLTGNPGCGKTILSAYLTEQLDSPTKSSSAALVCFYFCDDRISAQKDGKSILRSLIYQILRRRRSLIKYLRRVYDEKGPSLASSFPSLWNVFLTIASDPKSGPINIIVDAIDECEEQTRNSFLSAVVDLLQKSKASDDQPSSCIKFFMTSRPNLTNNYIFNGILNRLPIEEYQSSLIEDVKLVIKYKIEQIVQKLHCPPDIKTFLEMDLFSKADQTFLWVSFVLKYIEESPFASKTEIQKIIADLPRDLLTTYQSFLATISLEYQDNARKLLRILVGSSRYLSLGEMNIAFTIRSEHKSIKQLEEDMQFEMRRTLQGTLGPLVRVSGDKVSLVHQSAKDFLLSSQLRQNQDSSISGYAVKSAEAALTLAYSCISYLLLDEFSIDQFCLEHQSPGLSSDESSDSSGVYLPTEEAVWDPFSLKEDTILKDQSALDGEFCESLLGRFDFFGYAALHWAEHLSTCESIAPTNLLKAARELMKQSSDRLKNWLRFFWHKTRMEYPYPEDFNDLLITAFYDLSGTLSQLLDDDTAYGQAEKDLSLFWAARRGSTAAVDVLLRHDADPNTRIVDRQTPLSAAAEHGHLAVVIRLVAEARTDINVEGRSNRSPLDFAAGQGHLSVVQTLLNHKSLRLDDQVNSNWTPLFWAVGGNHMDIIRLLHQSSPLDINHRDNKGRTAISWAAGEGFEEPLKYFLKRRDVDPNIQDSKHRSPLSWAAGNGHAGAVKILMKNKRVDKLSKDSDGRNAISWACGGGGEDALKILIHYDCPGIDDEDIDGWTPLAWALNRNSMGLVRTLLSTQQVKIDRQDKGGRTPLSWSACYGYSDIVALLLTQGADITLTDEEGYTALDWAKMYGHTKVIQALENNRSN